jgi:hypothetical protein
MGLPYSEEPETTPLVKYSRGTLAELFEKIDADIEAGLPLINDEIYKIPKYHFNKKAAYAFATKFNLFYHKYDKVIKYANEVLGGNPANMLRNWKAISTAASNWTVRTNMYIDAGETANLLVLPMYSTWPYVHGPYSLGLRYGNSRTLIQRQSVRANGIWGAYGNLYMAMAMWGFDQKIVTSKYGGYFEYTDKAANIGYIHLVIVPLTTDETLLCRAEAYLLKSPCDTVNAVADINTWISTHCNVATPFKPYTKEDIIKYYNSVNYMPLVPENDLPASTEHTIKKHINPQGFTVEEGDQEALIQCILHLRRLETVHDGSRWADIKRYGIEFSHNRSGLAADILLTDDPRRAVQLPQDVIVAGLAPNPRRN